MSAKAKIEIPISPMTRIYLPSAPGGRRLLPQPRGKPKTERFESIVTEFVGLLLPSDVEGSDGQRLAIRFATRKKADQSFFS